jgi:hypothetical protein
MNLKFALVGLAALGGDALSTETTSAMPIGLATNPDNASNIDQVRFVCNAFRTPLEPARIAYNYYGGGPTGRIAPYRLESNPRLSWEVVARSSSRLALP